MNNNTQAAIAIGAALLALVYLSRKAGAAVGEAAAAVGTAVNPAGRDNLFYRGVNAVGDVLDDGGRNDSFSLGSSIYDWIHGPNIP